MNEGGKSDCPVVPANPPNNAVEAVAEVGEGRGRAKGNTDSKTRPGHSAGQGASSALGRVREVARRDKEARFTALLHHVSLGRLRAGLLGDPSAGGTRGGRGDMAGLRAGPGAQSPRPAREGPGGALPGEAESAGAHPEGGRAATAARDRIAGGQDCPAGR